MRRRDLLGGLSLVPLAAPAVAQCVVATFPRINLPGWCEGSGDLPSLDLSFMTPGSLDPRITFTRASVGTYFDSAGVMQTAATNAPRWDHDPATLQLRGLLIEEARTNLLLNSATLSTQSVTVTAVAHTLSFTGTGTITRSGVSTGALVGTGATQRVSVTFTPTAGSLTCTVTGSVTNAQLEVGAFATSYIPSAGVAATRAVDVATMPVGSWYSQTQGSLLTDASYNGARPATFPNYARFDDGTNNNLISHLNNINTARAYATSTAGAVAGWAMGNTSTFGPGPIYKMASSWISGAQLFNLNGIQPQSAAVVAIPAGITTLRIGIDQSLNVLASINMRRVAYWSGPLSAADLQRVTA